MNSNNWRPNILIVEDDSTIRELWCRILAPLKADVFEASTQRDALKKVSDADILVLDWYIGEDPADNVVDAWLSCGGGPLCVVSDRATVRDLEGLYARGAYNILEKPLAVEVLLSIIRHYMLDVESAHKLFLLSAEVKRLRRAVLLLAFAALGLGSIGSAPEIYNLIMALF